MTDYEINAFRRAKGQRVVAEYVIIDTGKLNRANREHFPNATENQLVLISSDMLKNTNVLEDYEAIMRLCKTYIADPEVFALCREIESRIAEILEARFLIFGKDRWLFEDQPLSIRSNDKEDLSQ